MFYCSRKNDLGLFQDLHLIRICAHHQNGVAERAIKTVMDWDRVLMLHAALRWPEVADASLWPMALDHAVFSWNKTPRMDSGLSPDKILSEMKTDSLNCWLQDLCDRRNKNIAAVALANKNARCRHVSG